MQTRDDIVAAARAVAERLGTKSLSMGEFRRETGIPIKDIYEHVRHWRDVCAAAGLDAKVPKNRLSDDEVLRAMRDAFLECGGIIGKNKFVLRYRHSPHVLQRRYKSWPGALVAFAKWAEINDPDFVHRAELAARIAEIPEAPLDVALPSPQIVDGPPWPSLGERACGEPVGFRALMHAPMNENGVILAFGMVAEELGFAVDAVAPAFPDCIAKRRVGESHWEPVRIEFEYRSRNFRDHCHDPRACDLIVCWEHDWPGAPIEVLELRAAIARLSRG